MLFHYSLLFLFKNLITGKKSSFYAMLLLMTEWEDKQDVLFRKVSIKENDHKVQIKSLDISNWEATKNKV